VPLRSEAQPAVPGRGSQAYPPVPSAVLGSIVPCRRQALQQQPGRRRASRPRAIPTRCQPAVLGVHATTRRDAVHTATILASCAIVIGQLLGQLLVVVVSENISLAMKQLYKTNANDRIARANE